MEQLLVFGLVSLSVIYVGKVIYNNMQGSKKGTCMTCNHDCRGCSQHRVK